MAREKSRRDGHEHRPDRALEAIRRAEQHALAEHAAEMADIADAVEVHEVAGAGGNSEKNDKAPEKREAGEIQEAREDREPAGGLADSGFNLDSEQYQETSDSGEIWGVAKAPLNSSDADALAEAEATLSGSAADFEAASETSDLPPISQWIFPKLPIYGPRRSGFDEAQAFFEFSRRLAALTENEGANAVQASTAQTERAVDTPGEGTAAAENDAKDDDSEAK